MAQQTAVSWLYEKITSNFWDIKECQHLLEQAKQIDKENEKQKLIGLLDWVNKVAKDNPMALETDHDDIVDMYLKGYYTTSPNTQNK